MRRARHPSLAAILATALALLPGCRTQPASTPTSREIDRSTKPAPAEQDEPPAAPAPASPARAEVTPAPWIEVTPLVRARRSTSGPGTTACVEFNAMTVLQEGFLEEYVCLVSTREHESAFVFEGKASDVHAALLLIGLEPGSPGAWRLDEAGDVVHTAPSGPPLAVEVILENGEVHPIEWFARLSPVSAAFDRETPPSAPSEFLFTGSRFRRLADGTELYLADGSGALIGLVTFGDETIAPLEVLPDQASIAPPIWECDPSRMPAPGTEVIIRIRPIS